MENIYTLGERFRRLSDDYDNAKAVLEAAYEENGGEVTDETEAKRAEVDELERMRQEIVADVLSAPDEYAAIVKNAEAQKKVLEAELKAVKEEQAKVCARIMSKIKAKEGKIAWFKENIAEALKLAEIERIGGARTDHRFCIFFSNTSSLDVDSEKVLAPYQERINDLIAALPGWVTVTTGINKAALKREDTLPEGAVAVSSKTLNIK